MAFDVADLPFISGQLTQVDGCGGGLISLPHPPWSRILKIDFRAGPQLRMSGQ